MFEMQELRKFLTIKVPGAQYTNKYRSHMWDGKKCFYNRMTDSFPIGFLNRVMTQWPGTKLIDERTYAPIQFRVPELYAIDSEYKPTGKVLEQRMYQKEALLVAFEYKNCLIQAATNAGKSVVIAALAKLLRQEKVVIIVHRVELLQQLKMMIVGMTGISVGYVTAEEVNIDPYVNIVMVMTLMTRIDTNPVVKEMFNRSKVLMVDECHHLVANTHQAAFCRSKAVYRFGFSGTIYDEDTYEGWLARQYIGDVKFEISNKELIDMGVSAEPKIKMVKFPHEIDYPAIVQGIREEDALQGIKYHSIRQEREEVYKRVFIVVMKKHIVNNVDRNSAIVNIVCGKYRNKQTLIVVDYLAHGRMIMDLMWEREKNKMDFIHGQSVTRRGSLLAFKEGELRILVSTSIVDEGIDIQAIEVLVLAGGRKSKRQILQRIGRGLRRKKGVNRVEVLDFYDLDNKYLEKHSKERYRIYTSEGFDVEIVDHKIGEDHA
jgi:superfamily II DNA or RNA helicase